MVFAKYSRTSFISNTAKDNGGAIHLGDNFVAKFHSKSHIMFSHNSANHHGGAIYNELISNTQSKIVINTTDIEFNNNTALIGSDVYMDIPTSCDDICLNNNIFIEVRIINAQSVWTVYHYPS